MIKILTHGWKAHVDEMIACAIIATAKKENVSITREERGEKYDKNDFNFVIDTGMKFDNEKLFDHHQDEDAVNGLSAAGLVTKKFYPKLLKTDNDFSRLIGRINFQDNNGIKNLCEEIKLNNYKEIDGLLFLERGLTKMFEEYPNYVINNIVAPMLKEKIDFVKKVNKAKEFLEENSKVTRIQAKSMNNIITMLEITKKFEGNDSALNKAQEEIIKNQGIDVVYSFDDRTENGRVLFRTENGAKKWLNFTQCNPKNEIFIHKNGFLCKFIPSTEEEKYILIEESV